MKKRTWLMIVSLVLTVAVSLGSTLAYLTSEDGDVNVMTVGRVEIKQHEYERVVDGNGDFVTVDTSKVNPNYGITSTYELQEFTQFKPALPAVYQQGEVKWDEQQQLWNQVGAPGSNDLFDDSVKNVIDKFVFVENTGSTDAYYRTIIAIECPEGMADGIIHLNRTGNGRFTWTPAGEEECFIKLNGTRYLLTIASYNEILTPGEVSRPSLLQLYLDPKATNEDVALFGENWEVLALSQGVQAAGFESAQAALDEAFPVGENYANVITWLEKLLGEEYPANMTKVPETKWVDYADTSWYNDTDNTYEIDTAEKLIGLAKLVNAGNTFKGKTVKLTAPVDLGSHQWTPIGTSSNKFQGNFDGGSNTISNLFVPMAGKSDVGLFGFTSNGTIKNVSVRNANVEGRLDVGVVAGQPYTTKYDNITVTGTVYVNGMSYVGGVFGKNVYANVSNVTVDVTSDSYVKADSVENGNAYRTYAGGVAGFVGEGGHTLSNMTSNIDVYGSTCDVGGLVGIAHYGNTFKNCKSTGDVYVLNDEDNMMELGGISGVWNNGGSNVTFDGCTFTGELYLNGAKYDVSGNDRLSGPAYSASGSGNLIVK